MPPRPPFPPRNQMGPPMGGMMSRGPFLGPNMSRSGFGPQMRSVSGAARNTGQGNSGLLAKLLGKGSATSSMGGGALNGAARSAGSSAAQAGGGLLKSLANPGTISGFLNNTQRVLNTAGQLGPMVQQYGPLVKNLPAMWKLYRGLKNTEPTVEEVSTSPGTDTKEKKKKSPKTERSSETSSIPIETKKQASSKGKSVPKIYV